MNAKDLAKRLEGREYGSEISHDEHLEARANRLVVVFGYSDDNVELRGLISDELSAWNGCVFHILPDGKLMEDDHECSCDYCGFGLMKEQAKSIEALWCDGDIPWTFDTEIPHEKFHIMEDGEVFCVGIVFSL